MKNTFIIVEVYSTVNGVYYLVGHFTTNLTSCAHQVPVNWANRCHWLPRSDMSACKWVESPRLVGDHNHLYYNWRKKLPPVINGGAISRPRLVPMAFTITPVKCVIHVGAQWVIEFSHLSGRRCPTAECRIIGRSLQLLAEVVLSLRTAAHYGDVTQVIGLVRGWCDVVSKAAWLRVDTISHYDSACWHNKSLRRYVFTY